MIGKKIKNEKGKLIEFEDHRFLLDLYCDESREMCVRKGSQVGVSTFAILKEIHSMLYDEINQIHTLPSDKDVWQFVPTKVDKMFKINNIRLEKDSSELKGAGDNFIFFKGTFSERAPIMISADRLIIDEVDKSKSEIIRDYSSRMTASKLAEKIWLSTPTIPDFGIDAVWLKSDQKHWRFTCPHCSYRQHMEWEKNVDSEREIYICQKCRKLLASETIRSGRWEARYPSREISGYWISQMIATYRSCKDLIKEQRDSEDDQYFYNFVLGLPYINSESRIPASLVLRNLTDIKNSESKASMGVDVGGRYLHAIIGNQEGVFGIAEIEDEHGKTKWERLGELMDVYDVRYCVIDAEWNTNECYDFAKRFPYRVYAQWYKDDPKKIKIVRFLDETDFTQKPKDFEEEIKVLVDRNRHIDALLADLREGRFKFNFKAGDARIAALIEHIQTMYVRTVTDRIGQEKREWASTTKKDHFLHAFNNYKVALDKQIRFTG